MYKIEIDTTSACFEGHEGAKRVELARILRNLAAQLSCDGLEGDKPLTYDLKDYNMNTVGTAQELEVRELVDLGGV